MYLRRKQVHNIKIFEIASAGFHAFYTALATEYNVVVQWYVTKNILSI